MALFKRCSNKVGKLVKLKIILKKKKKMQLLRQNFIRKKNVVEKCLLFKLRVKKKNTYKLDIFLSQTRVNFFYSMSNNCRVNPLQGNVFLLTWYSEMLPQVAIILAAVFTYGTHNVVIRIINTVVTPRNCRISASFLVFPVTRWAILASQQLKVRYGPQFGVLGGVLWV